MSFTNNFKQIENIKSNYATNYLRQEVLMKEYLKNISKVAIDSNAINNTFADLVAPYLSKSDFNLFNRVIMTDEVQFISDAVGHGDILSFEYADNKQINKITYQNSDKLISVILRVKKDKVSVVKVINVGDKIVETKSTFKKSEDEFYQNTFSKKVITSEDDFMTYAKEEYRYDKERDELTKDFSIVTKELGRVISKSSISSIIDKANYVIDEGKFYTINKKSEYNKMKKCKKLENKLVGLYN